MSPSLNEPLGMVGSCINCTHSANLLATFSLVMISTALVLYFEPVPASVTPDGPHPFVGGGSSIGVALRNSNEGLVWLEARHVHSGAIRQLSKTSDSIRSWPFLLILPTDLLLRAAVKPKPTDTATPDRIERTQYRSKIASIVDAKP
jgi:hypothetical protein